MKCHVVNIEDLRWLLGHTGGFRGGYVTDVQVSKRRLLDEASGREVPAGTTVTVVIRYRIHQMSRVAKLTMTGVTDFSMFEQEGADCSTLGVIQAELNEGKLRFWFDPQGELYVVCEEAQLEEPEGAVFTPAGRLAYHGRIDNRVADFGKERPAPTQRDLHDAIEAVLAGKNPRSASEPAVGCRIAHLP